MTACRRTKIVSTLGPAIESKEKIETLIELGVNVFRVNGSHGSHEEHLRRINTVKQVREEKNKPVAILFDLQGPKIRVGKLKNGSIELIEGNELVIVSESIEGTEERISTNYPNLAVDVNIGDAILLNDGVFALEVIGIEDSNVKTVVKVGGTLLEKKGINLPGTTNSLSAISEKDKNDIKYAVENEVDFLALSFVRSAKDLRELKKILKEYNAEDIQIIAKVEKPQALENIDEIVQEADGIMVARGDLGVELAPQKVPFAQKSIIRNAKLHNKFVITATQMLESMIESPVPTRAEASDVANAILDGTDAVMLSAETSIGKYPIQAVKMMASIAAEIESAPPKLYQKVLPMITTVLSKESHSIALSAVEMSKEINPSAIVAFTSAGFSARLISSFKPQVPIIAVTHNPLAARQLNINCGVYPYIMEIDEIDQSLFTRLDALLKEKTFLQEGDSIIIAGGMPYLVTGITNFIRFHQIG